MNKIKFKNKFSLFNYKDTYKLNNNKTLQTEKIIKIQRGFKSWIR